MNQINKNRAVCTAIFGTGSDVGKSIVSAALCRMINNLGYRVAPFKAQNMSNNSFVTLEGGEMGRAQVVQAEAARVDPHVDMNPVLLKPSADNRSQVVLQGKAPGEKLSGEYWKNMDYLFNKALESLRAVYEFIVMEGAGSIAVRLRMYRINNTRVTQNHEFLPTVIPECFSRESIGNTGRMDSRCKHSGMTFHGYQEFEHISILLKILGISP